MKTNHAPGPWIYDETWGLIHDGRKSARGPHVSAAEICAVHAGRTGKLEESKANALLITSAPELLAALIELCADKYLSDPINADRMKNARAAIQRAQGEA